MQRCDFAFMKQATFVIYGCPFTAYEATKTSSVYTIPESDSSLYHFKRNINRILNLVGFSGIKDIRLVGCSAEFINEFRALVAKCPRTGFHVSEEPKAHAAFGEDFTGEATATDVVVVEKQPRLIPIASQLSRGRAKVIGIDPISNDEAASFMTGQADFEEGSGLARQNGLDNCCALIRKKLGAGFFTVPHSSVTFITRFPYNLYPFPYPTGHLPECAAGELVVAGLLKAKNHRLQTGTAVVLDSGKTQKSGTPSEYETLRRSLCQNYGVLPTHRPATLGDFKYFVEYIPADLIFLTAHCGNIRFIEREATFCYKGKAGHVRYAVNRCVSAVPKSGLVDCQTNYMPIEVNGVSWKVGECDRGLFMKFADVESDASLGMKPRNPDFAHIVIRPTVNTAPLYSPAKCLGCGDDQDFVPLTNTIGCYYFPLVFNNACASYSGICEEFALDVSFYIGTTRPVDSFSAVDVVTKFVQNLGKMNVGQALYEAQRSFINSYTPYLLAGVPWLSMPKYASPTISIMRANDLLKSLRESGSGAHRIDHPRQVFQEQQRKNLLGMLFVRGLGVTS
jgi:hypothetical protein